MAQEVFAEGITVTGTAGGTITLGADPTGTSFTLIEADGNIDGSTPIGGGATLTFTGFPGFNDSDVVIYAFTSEGPIVRNTTDNQLTLLTNNSSLTSGTQLVSTTTGSYPYCFAEGTLIATEHGQKRVERLAIDDRILTADGRAVPVTWIGRQTVSTRFHPAERLLPVRVRAGALGNGLPERDLVLTADHALLIDGLLINAGALVNGSSIDYVSLSELGESYTVYHIETKNHDVILAEGAPAETYIDYAARRAFDNYAEYLALYGEDRTIPEMAYPRISSARMLPAGLKARLGMSRAA